MSAYPVRAIRRMVFATLASVLALSHTAIADEGFYAGKQVRLVIGFGAGGSYDLYGQLVARHIGKFLPGNPTIVPESMPTAGSMNAVNYLYNVAPRDGTVIGTVASGAPTMPFFYPTQAKFDASRLIWIGSVAKAVYVDVVESNVPVKTVEDLKTKEVILGASGPGAALVDLPKLMNAIAGFHYRLVMGYNAVPDIYLAMSRGEVQGVSGTTWDSISRAPGYASGAIRVVLQYGSKKVPELPNVPLATSLVKNQSDLQTMNLLLARQDMGKPFLAPPGLPAARIAELRNGFMRMTKDADFLADAKKTRLDVDAIDGATVQNLVDEVQKTPPAVVARVKAILSSK